MIEGINIRCTIGPFEVLRSPRIELTYRRRAVCSRAALDIPDTNGTVRANVVQGDAVRVRFGYRGENTLWHDWQGTVEGVEQAGPDTVRVAAVGREKALTTTMVTESFYGEPASVVARRLLERTGLPVAEVGIPPDVLPHQVFSGVSVARAIKQLECSLTRSFGHDLTRHAVWLGANGLRWSAGDEPGDVYLIESAANLLTHTPPVAQGGMGSVSAVLLPGLTASRKVRIRDSRRAFAETVRAQEVTHLLGENTTTVLYGADNGWG